MQRANKKPQLKQQKNNKTIKKSKSQQQSKVRSIHIKKLKCPPSSNNNTPHGISLRTITTNQSLTLPPSPIVSSLKVQQTFLNGAACFGSTPLTLQKLRQSHVFKPTKPKWSNSDEDATAIQVLIDIQQKQVELLATVLEKQLQQEEQMKKLATDVERLVKYAKIAEKEAKEREEEYAVKITDPTSPTAILNHPSGAPPHERITDILTKLTNNMSVVTTEVHHLIRTLYPTSKKAVRASYYQYNTYKRATAPQTTGQPTSTTTSTTTTATDPSAPTTTGQSTWKSNYNKNTTSTTATTTPTATTATTTPNNNNDTNNTSVATITAATTTDSNTTQQPSTTTTNSIRPPVKVPHTSFDIPEIDLDFPKKM